MACPAEGWFGLFLKLATPYDVSQTHAIRYSLTECTCSVLCACCLPAFGSRGRISPRGGAVMSTSTHMSHVRRIRRWNHRGSIEAAQ